MAYKCLTLTTYYPGCTSNGTTQKQGACHWLQQSLHGHGKTCAWGGRASHRFLPDLGVIGFLVWHPPFGPVSLWKNMLPLEKLGNQGELGRDTCFLSFYSFYLFVVWTNFHLDLQLRSNCRDLLWLVMPTDFMRPCWYVGFSGNRPVGFVMIRLCQAGDAWRRPHGFYGGECGTIGPLWTIGPLRNAVSLKAFGVFTDAPGIASRNDDAQAWVFAAFSALQKRVALVCFKSH